MQLMPLSLFTVDDKKQFFNPDCSLEILVDNIRKRCLCPSDCKFTPLVVVFLSLHENHLFSQVA